MTALDTAELVVRWAGAVAAVVMTGLVLSGLFRARSRAVGRTVGMTYRKIPVWVFVLLSVVYLAAMILLWRRIPITLPTAARIAVLVIGALLYFGGLALVVWGKVTLGAMYNVSTSMGVELFTEHRLVKNGPFGLVRHPMYVGGMLWGLGALLIYQTWTVIFYIAHYWVWFLRARREEQALASEFGPEWEAYCREVPAWFPRLPQRREMRVEQK